MESDEVEKIVKEIEAEKEAGAFFLLVLWSPLTSEYHPQKRTRRRRSGQAGSRVLLERLEMTVCRRRFYLLLIVTWKDERYHG